MVEHSDAKPEMKDGKWYCDKCSDGPFVSRRATSIHIAAKIRWEKSKSWMSKF